MGRFTFCYFKYILMNKLNIVSIAGKKSFFYKTIIFLIIGAASAADYVL